jgi:hypothetical protein
LEFTTTTPTFWGGWSIFSNLWKMLLFTKRTM